MDGATSKLAEAKKVFQKEQLQFRAACKALGAAFARNRWHIMIGTPDWEQLASGHTVANYVVQGASSEPPLENAGNHRILFYSPRETEPPGAASAASDTPGTLEELKSLKNLAFEDMFTARGGYKAKLIPNITEVDAVLLVAGGDGTASIGYAAYSLGRPVVAIAGFGGAARAIYEDVLADTYDRYKDAAGLTDGELRSLVATWKPEAEDKTNRACAESVVHVTEKLVKGWGQSSRQTTRVLGWSMAGMGALLALWVFVFLHGAWIGQPQVGVAPSRASVAAQRLDQAATLGARSPAAASAPVVGAVSGASDNMDGRADSSSAQGANAAATTGTAGATEADGQGQGDGKVGAPAADRGDGSFLPVAFFLLLYISAAVGTGLRVLVAYQSNQIARLTLFAVGIELVIAMTVAFGLALFYLIGSISFTGGQVVALVPGSATFAPIAVSMSLLGLASGFLVPLDKLRDKLQKIFAEEQK